MYDETCDTPCVILGCHWRCSDLVIPGEPPCSCVHRCQDHRETTGPLRWRALTTAQRDAVITILKEGWPEFQALAEYLESE